MLVFVPFLCLGLLVRLVFLMFGDALRLGGQVCIISRLMLAA